MIVALCAIVASAVGAALVGAGVTSWIDAAPEGPEGPVTERDYRPMLPRCSYRACGAESAGTVADFELCRDHLDAAVARVRHADVGLGLHPSNDGG